MSVFWRDLGKYLDDGWEIISTSSSSAYSEADEEKYGRVFLLTIKKGRSVRVLGYEQFVSVEDDEVDPVPYNASFVKNLAD